MDHPVLVPSGGAVTVRWLRHTDGRCHARDYYEANSACRASLLALARQLALRGVVGRVPQNGHRLQGEFADLTELKPGDHRFFGFRDRGDWFITNGAPKTAARKQRADYALALAIRNAFLITQRRK